MVQKHLNKNFSLFLGIYGGFLLGVRSVNGLAFYDWDNTELIRRIEIQPKHVSFPSIVTFEMCIFVSSSGSLRLRNVHVLCCPCSFVLDTVPFTSGLLRKSELWYLNEAVDIGYFEKYKKLYKCQAPFIFQMAFDRVNKSML